MVEHLFEALCYKPEGLELDSRWCHWKVSLAFFRAHYTYSPGVHTAAKRNEYREYFRRGK
jgi:hypothetical protein